MSVKLALAAKCTKVGLEGAGIVGIHLLEGRLHLLLMSRSGGRGCICGDLVMSTLKRGLLDK